MTGRWFVVLGGFLSAALLLGCSANKPKEEKMADVKGTVKVDGMLLADGDITFVGDPGSIPDSLPIRAGGFEGKVKVGKRKVEIRAYETKKAPSTATAGVTEVKENYLPDKYNKNTTLAAEITESGISPNTFDLKR